MKITDDKIKKIMRKSGHRRPRGACPSDETLSAFVEDRLGPEAHEEILAHLSRCRACLESVKIMRAIMGDSEEESLIRVPGSALRRARGLDPASKSIIEVVVHFVKGAAKVVKMSGDAVGAMVPVMESVRGEGRVLSETLVSFTKEFAPYLAEVDVEKVRPESGEITVRLNDKDTEQAASGLRVSLYQQEQELESLMLREGVAVFENLSFGRYTMEITKVGEPLGRITLEMKGEAK